MSQNFLNLMKYLSCLTDDYTYDNLITMLSMPIYTTTTEIQRNFKNVVRKAKKAKDGVIVLSNNNPIGVYTAYENYLSTIAVKKKAKDDLLALAGTMSVDEVDKLNKDMDEMFEKIDDDMWK